RISHHEHNILELSHIFQSKEIGVNRAAAGRIEHIADTYRYYGCAVELHNLLRGPNLGYKPLHDAILVQYVVALGKSYRLFSAIGLSFRTDLLFVQENPQLPVLKGRVHLFVGKGATRDCPSMSSPRNVSQGRPSIKIIGSPCTDFELVGVHDTYHCPFLTAICPYRRYILICLAVSGQRDHGLSIPVVCTYRRSSDPVGCSIVRLVVDQYITDVALAKIEDIGVVLRQGSER